MQIKLRSFLTIDRLLILYNLFRLTRELEQSVELSFLELKFSRKISKKILGIFPKIFKKITLKILLKNSKIFFQKILYILILV